jgi:hypothetical protein
MSFSEFRLRGVEILPHLAEEIKRDICMIIAGIDHRIDEATLQYLITDASLLYTTGLISRGTGFLTSDGYVITAYHVIEKAVDIKCLPCAHNNLISLKLTKADDVHDIAWLKPEIKWSKGINIKYRAQPKKGDLVFTLGYPFYIISEPILSVGFFSNVLEEGGIKRFLINAAFNVGNSGGPLFDLEGRLVGIVRAKSLLKHPMIQIAFRMLEKPSVEIIYEKIKLPDGSEREMTLGGIIRMLISWVADNTQTNIGEAIPAEYLME